MKKIFGLLILIIGLFNSISFAQNEQPMGITMDQDCLLNGQCKFNIYQFLGIRTSIADASSPELFVQDILLSATFFIGTIVTIALVVSGLMFIFAGATGKDPTKAKAGIKNSFIGLLIVVSSYSIIRVVQYIAKGL
ncbi:MAG: hypothetical protein PHR61_00480 [Candidatus Absconditabacteria bacterium]|nr:hypothetical protein [Candidatus Absconditabacteria bacterium]